MRRMLAFILALSLCLPLLPTWAEETQTEPTETVETTETEAVTEPEEGTEAVAEPEETETEAPTEEATEEVTEAPTEAPTEESTEEPTEESTEPAETPETEPTEQTEETEEPEEALLQETVFVNPLYEDVLTEADIPGAPTVAAYAASEYTRYTSEEAASEAMRQSLRNRDATFTGELVLDGVPVADTFMKSLYSGAVAHTGVPTEGDYLRYEFGGFRGSLSAGSRSDGKVLCQFTYSFLYYTTEAQEAAVDAEVSRLLEELALEEKDDKGKVDAIYDYLCRTVTYDYANLNDQSYVLKYTAYAALLDHTAVCQGYAAAFYRLCLETGVDARVISSRAMNHAWNIVQLGRFYFCVDATWDAGYAPDTYRYYLKGSTYWLEKHQSVGNLGDQFRDEEFDQTYAVPKESYAELSGAYTLTEDGTLILGLDFTEKIYNCKATDTGEGYLLTSAPWREVAEKVRRIEFLPGLTYIGSHAFRGLRNLEELVLPDTVEAVEDSAFRDCVGLKTLVIQGKPEVADNAFSGCDGIESLTIPAAQDARFLSGCLKNLNDLSLTGDDYMYNGYSASRPAPWSGTGVTSVSIGDDVGKIGNYGFASCAALESLTLPSRLRYVGSYAFRGCKSLKEVVFTGEKQPNIYSGAFAGDKLTCVYPCAWAAKLSGGYGGTVTWKASHTLEAVAEVLPTQEADGVVAHYRCADCGKRFREAACETELTEEDVALYRDSYTITYMDMERGENPNPDTYQRDQGQVLAVPSRVGYLFGGWYLDGGYTKKITSIAKGSHGDKVLYPKWSPIGYTLAFNANGGSGSASRRSLRYDVDTILPSTGFKRTGYTLTGWNTAKNGTGESDSLGETVRNLTAKDKAAVTLYAQWSPNAYLLLLDPNDGVTEASSREMLYDRSWVLPTEAGEKLGYHISGWNTRADGRGKTYTPGKAVKNLTAQAAGQVVLYGKWAINSYKVLFHGNGANVKDRAQTMTYGKTTVLAANAFKRTGYVFRGWSDSPEGEVVYNNKEKVTSLTAKQGGIVDLYAVWEPISYRLAFQANGGQGTMETLECTYDRETELPELAFARPGFTFLGWSTSASGKVRYEAGTNVKNLTATQGRTVTLYALWRAHSYEIHFNGGEGTTGTMKPMLRLACGKAYTLTANGFKKPGYAFTGWVDGEGNPYKNQERRTNFALEDGDVRELYAQWAPIQYKITYQRLIAGDENPNPLTFTVEKDVVLADPIRPGCEFLGWYLDSACKKPIDSIPAGSRRANLTLYAKWASGGKGYGYTITFDGNGAASGKVSPLTKRYNGTVYTLPANGFKYPGHTFLGWSLNPEATAPTWKNKGKVSNLAGFDGETVVLYAVWK